MFHVKQNLANAPPHGGLCSSAWGSVGGTCRSAICSVQGICPAPYVGAMPKCEMLQPFYIIGSISHFAHKGELILHAPPCKINSPLWALAPMGARHRPSLPHGDSLVRTVGSPHALPLSADKANVGGSMPPTFALWFM